MTAPSKTASLKRLRATRDFQNATSAVEAMTAAGDAFEAGEFPQAAERAQAAQRTLPGWWAPFFVQGLVAVQTGQQSVGLAQLNRATTANDAPYPVFERTAAEYFDSGNTAGAFRVLDRASQRFGGPDVTWLDRIALYEKMGDQAAAESVRKQCIKSPNIGLREECGKTTFSSFMR